MSHLENKDLIAWPSIISPDSINTYLEICILTYFINFLKICNNIDFFYLTISRLSIYIFEFCLLYDIKTLCLYFSVFRIKLKLAVVDRQANLQGFQYG
ncbi:hypothetical protein HanXRQr2_Chr03g0089031 [Helianthus annuus]|uniref:Uncharacterized protein n=1 Tax=Helianthus annuus TaxID=4232 RepID=A0A9K3NTK5_HELAN|nr:hypothetical protein HanXRQr2_Chr03g0089031 [Helianthus annuus]KAJ0495835.1 hypothetical protein HanIR_Chr12g0613381 [Helianthus annuus]KAJ0772475.1 hypothetical protein HanOQP8_Chr03g0087741 [Helianthus annuus]KAJ0941896.1 hypothetical protein HanPSC8_Chr03g0085511 [Helianthus annuus]